MTRKPLAAPALPARRKLAETIEDHLRRMLSRGDVKPGERLPTENALAKSHGVSRAVIREALAGLRADGLVVARQGSGVFAADGTEPPKHLSLANFDPAKLSSIIEVLELRAAVEGEAAGLAAQRITAGELIRLRECHAAVAAALDAGRSAQDQDFALHLAIADATHNSHFVEFFRFLGARTIPRAQIISGPSAMAPTRRELRRFHEEHAEIVTAIADRDPAAACAAMQRHLKSSQERYARVAESTASATA
ncbi:MAG: FadR/GntR family transcriptional regulator [Pseudomonadota bacterium]